MKMSGVSIKFDVGDAVSSNSSKFVLGRVTLIMATSNGTQYEVKYFGEDKEKTEWFSEEELKHTNVQRTEK